MISTAGVLTLHYRGGRHVGTVAVNLLCVRRQPSRSRDPRFVLPTEVRNQMATTALDQHREVNASGDALRSALETIKDQGSSSSTSRA